MINIRFNYNRFFLFYITEGFGYCAYVANGIDLYEDWTGA